MGEHLSRDEYISISKPEEGIFNNGILYFDDDQLPLFYQTIDNAVESAQACISDMNSIMECCRDIIDFSDIAQNVNTAVNKVKRLENLKAEMTDYAVAVDRFATELSGGCRGILAEHGGLPESTVPVETAQEETGSSIYEELLASGDRSFLYNDADMQTVIGYLEQIDRLEQMSLNAVNPNQQSAYRDEISKLKGAIEMILVQKITGMNHSAAFSNVYEYLNRLGYSTMDKVKIFCHWAKVDGDDSIIGYEMPEWWYSEHLTPPEELVVTEENHEDLEYSEDMFRWYYQEYYIIELISGQCK